MAKTCLVCENEAAVKCANCVKQLYCGEDHRKSHSAAHKADCSPCTVEKNDTYGRYLVTTRSVKPGELLLREKPVIVGPRIDTLPCCQSCFAPLYSPSRCSKCVVTPLCAQCTHEPLECAMYCGLSQQLKDRCLYSGNQHVLPLRVLLHIRSDKEEDDRFKRILELEAHLEARKGTAVWHSHQKNVFELLRDCGLVTDSREDYDLIQRICGVLDVNSFEVRGTLAPGLRLRGVYLQAALMAHDCLANTHLSVDNNYVMTVRASVDIPAGQPVFYNYTDPLQTTSERQKHLQEGKYFCCQCRRCSDPSELGSYLSAVWCPKCKKGRALPSAEGEDWVCDSCGKRFVSGLMSLTLSTARSSLDSVDRSDPAQLEAAIIRMSRTFAPSHSLLLDLCQGVVAAHREAPPTALSLRRSAQLCRNMLPTLRLLEPGISRLVGITLYELHICLVSLAQEHREPEHLTEAEEVLREALSLLIYEPIASPEGELARQAVTEMKILKQLVAKQQLKEKKNNHKPKNKTKSNK